MRSPKLTQVAVAAAALLALAPASAVAAGRHPRLNAPRHAGAGGCRVDIFAEPRTITLGESVQLFGQLRCPPGTKVEGQTVTVYQRAAGKSGFQTLGTATTGAGGSYSIIDTNVSADSIFFANTLGARSPSKRVKVAPLVTLGQAPTPPEGAQLLTGAHNRVTFVGSVSPDDFGAEVILQRENSVGSSEEWKAIQIGSVGAGGLISMVHKFVVPGDANIRFLVRAHGKFTARAASSPISYQISQAENPLLTIETKPADSIPFGQSITLSGVLKGAANQKVMLFSHPRGALPFTKVGEASTNGEGAYSFPEQPQQNTFYQLDGPSLKSSVLFEGVKYVLAANAPATSVQDGQALTFSGAVTPGGANVYLERENAFGGGFHVVDGGAVSTGATGTYSITHFVFGGGKQVFRIKVPGNPQNQSVASSPYDVEVTPAPLGSLHPAPQGKQPSEGQI